jgi:gliding motility-associated-like protein
MLVSAVMISASSLYAQQFYRTELSSPMTSGDSARNIAEEKKSWTEISGKRTLNSRSYVTPSGSTMIEQCARPINYYVNGQLEPIDATIKISEDDGWVAKNQPFPVYISRDGSYALTSSSGQRMIFGSDASYNDHTKSNPEFVSSENQILFYNVAPGVHRQLDIRENGVKSSFIIPEQIEFSDESFVGESILLPEGFTMFLDEHRGEMKDSIWYGDIIIRNAEGKQEACIRQTFCFDNANSIGRCGYYIEKHPEENLYIISSYLPVDWLRDAARQFPIVIDPLVTGPQAVWTGGFIPSCDIPNYSQDSILVTIPGQITITALLVTGSFYADPFSIAVMADGAMYFSTDCNQTQNFTVAPPNGNLPGTAYLLAYNMSSPLTCCWPQSCQQQQFWLSMHIGRTVGGPGCNTNYVYYDPNTQYPFTAYIEGHTVEYTAVGWNCPNTALCADSCTITGTAYIRYGVPPYIIGHPWMIGTDTVGVAAGCSTGSVVHQMSLSIPNCPVLCDTQTVLVVPPPYVIDQCGNYVLGLPTDNVPRKPVPVVSANPQNVTVCSGQQYVSLTSSCKPNTTISWSDGTNTGTGNISGTYINNGTSDTSFTYYVSGVLNGCYSDTIQVAVTIDPDPIAAFTYTQPAIAGLPVTITDQSTTGASSVNSWMYVLSTGDTLYSQNPTYVFPSPGIYTICQWIGTGNSCTDSTCRTIEVIPAEVIAPNVITPNGDGINDLLVFQFLEYYPNNNLTVYNRWGNLIYEKASYANDWNAQQFSDGTYYYVLTIQGQEEALRGFFAIIQ